MWQTAVAECRRIAGACIVGLLCSAVDGVLAVDKHTADRDRRVEVVTDD